MGVPNFTTPQPLLAQGRSSLSLSLAGSQPRTPPVEFTAWTSRACPSQHLSASRQHAQDPKTLACCFATDKQAKSTHSVTGFDRLRNGSASLPLSPQAEAGRQGSHSHHHALKPSSDAGSPPQSTLIEISGRVYHNRTSRREAPTRLSPSVSRTESRGGPSQHTTACEQTTRRRYHVRQSWRNMPGVHRTSNACTEKNMGEVDDLGPLRGQ